MINKKVFVIIKTNNVSTDEHWSRNWKRAPLNWEKKK